MEDAGLTYANAFAYNFKTLYVPYPIPPIGRVSSGILTFSAYAADSATRVSLPCPFSYPIRLANLKRCLLVERIPVADSDKELVLVNLHLEAYDDGEGKAAQTAQLASLLTEEAEKGNYVIAGGDFNQSFDVTDVSAYPNRGDDLWQPGVLETAAFSGLQCLQDTAVPSCRSIDRAYDPEDENFQYYVLDGYLLSDNLSVEMIQTVDLGFANSDHNPVRLQVTLR
jgi:endonuclease/exonuclease/phosphatase family metal-dependent hydrolase